MVYRWFTLVYVFDATAQEGREFKRRMPRFLARIICNRSSMVLDWTSKFDDVL